METQRILANFFWLASCATLAPCHGQAPIVTSKPLDLYLGSRCAETLPLDGHTRIRQDGGLMVKYPCTDLLEIPLSRYHDLLAVRDSVYSMNLQRQRAVQELPGAKKYLRIIESGFSPGGMPLSPGEDVFLEADAECYQELRLFHILTRVANLQTIGRQVTDSFAFQLALPGEGGNEPFMDIHHRSSNIMGEQFDWWVVDIPREVLWVSEMSDDLLVFMLLHEMGHAVQLPETELNADWWAMNVGLPGYYGEERAAELRLPIAEAFRAYCMAVYTDETFSKSTCTIDHVDQYPSLECRMRGIAGPDWLDENGERVESYVDISECWANAQQDLHCGPRPRTLSIGDCCPEPPPEPSMNNVIPFAVDIQRELKNSLLALSFFEGLERIGMCGHKVDLCGMSSEQRKVWIDKNVSSFDRKSRSIRKLLLHGTLKVKALEQDLMGE